MGKPASSWINRGILLGTCLSGGALLTIATPAAASADAGCATIYSTDQSNFAGCDSFTLLAMSPAADTRMTMWMLLMDQKNDRRMPVNHDSDAGRWSEGGWKQIMAGLLPPAAPNAPRIAGSADRCNSDASGAAAFIAAVRAARSMSESDKAALIAGRQALSEMCGSTTQRQNNCQSWRSDRSGCDTPIAQPGVVSVSGSEAREFATYLAAATAFYSADFPTAQRAFATIGNARNSWVKEAAVYMFARSGLNAMQVGLFGEWGNFDRNALRNPSLAAPVEAAFQSYLSSYRTGRYSASAKGLMRRVYWLSNQTQKLVDLYDEAARNGGGGADPVDFANEVDLKLFANPEARFTATSPVLLTALALSRMRAADGRPNSYTRNLECCEGALTRQELDSWRPHFAGQAALYDFLLANHDMYVAHQPRAVLERIADASRAARFNHLDFSRQFLRGQALTAARDPAADRHWRNMLTGAAEGYQKDAVELALARLTESAGRIDSIFTGSTPLHIQGAREVLLMNSASAALLRQQAGNRNATPRERSIAAYTLLYKRLSRGEFADFTRDLAVIPDGTAPAQDNQFWQWNGGVAPEGVFTTTQSDAYYRCPSMPQIAQQLTANPRNIRASMCLGEFTRLTRMDAAPIDQQERGNWLGGGTPVFPVGAYNRQAIYQRVIADRAAPAEDRAYALYRAVNCYGPSGYNTCGGETVPQTQRRAWFTQLKRDYAQTRWAREQRYYW